MNAENITAGEKFYRELSNHMKYKEEMSLRKIYSLFPQMNRSTVSWRLHSLVQEGKLYKTGHGLYSAKKNSHNNAAGYEYLHKKSQMIYDILTDYGHKFYITGLDSLVGEILHIPEKYPVLLVIEESGINEIQEILNEKSLFVLTEKDQDILEKTFLRNKVDVIILKGKDFLLSFNNIARKEKGFIDLYYAVTRMEYAISVPELSRIYENLLRNNSITTVNMRNAAKDRGISTEINWLIDLGKIPKKTLEFMSYQIKGVI